MHIHAVTNLLMLFFWIKLIMKMRKFLTENSMPHDHKIELEMTACREGVHASQATPQNVRRGDDSPPPVTSGQFHGPQILAPWKRQTDRPTTKAKRPWTSSNRSTRRRTDGRGSTTMDLTSSRVAERICDRRPHGDRPRLAAACRCRKGASDERQHRLEMGGWGRRWRRIAPDVEKCRGWQWQNRG